MRRVRGRSDGELIAATPGDPEAFAEFYRRYERSVIGFFMHWCRSAEVAADLMAETFAAAFESAARYQPELGEPSAWLFGTARNMLARSVRRGRVEDETRRRLGMTALVVDDDAIDRIDALAAEDGEVVHALGELSARLRDAVSGRVIEDREYRELAEALSCSQSVVRQRVRRGLSRIRQRLEVNERRSFRNSRSSWSSSRPRPAAPDSDAITAGESRARARLLRRPPRSARS
jgi:RNA polymerase sigma-70 factor, ECF subfamily